MRDKVLGTFAGVMGLASDGLTGQETPDDIPVWDSFKHMNLVLALEEDFGIMLDDDDIVDMVRLDEIVRIVAHKVADTGEAA